MLGLTRQFEKGVRTMFYAEWTRDNERYGGLYFSWETFHRDTFGPIKDLRLVEFKINGKTYAEKKADSRNIAIEWQTMDHVGLYWSEVGTIMAWFEKTGRQYGLRQEFRENGVI